MERTTRRSLANKAKSLIVALPLVTQSSYQRTRKGLDVSLVLQPKPLEQVIVPKVNNV